MLADTDAEPETTAGGRVTLGEMVAPGAMVKPGGSVKPDGALLGAAEPISMPRSPADDGIAEGTMVGAVLGEPVDAVGAPETG